jgi:hypothetical protein
MKPKIPEPSQNKIYVKVTAIFYTDGRLIPISFVWEDGHRYEIDQIKSIIQAASLKAGGTGMRYTCMVRGHETYLFFEEDRWFMERR